MPSRMSFIAAIMFLGACATLQAQESATAAPSAAQAKAYEPSIGQAGKDVVWVPTPQTLVDRMLNMAELGAGDHLVDLGSGDGRTVITAAKRGATARGIEYNPELVELSRRAAAQEGVDERAKFEHADIFESDFSSASVVTLFLLPSLNLKLRPILLDMKPGTRVVSNSFGMDDWEPDATAQVKDDCTNYCNAYKWIIPAKVAGTWKMGDKELALTQRFQMLGGVLRDGGNTLPLKEARMHGAQITFTVDNMTYTGTVDGKKIQGTINGKENWDASLLSMQ